MLILLFILIFTKNQELPGGKSKLPYLGDLKNYLYSESSFGEASNLPLPVHCFWTNSLLVASFAFITGLG